MREDFRTLETASTNTSVDYGPQYNLNTPQGFSPEQHSQGTIGFGDDEADPKSFNLDNSKIALTDNDTPPKLNKDQIEAKARQAHVALGDESPGVDALKSQLDDGNEQGIRKSLDSRGALAFDVFKRQQLEKIARATGTPLTNEDYASARAITYEQYSSDPATALERVFAQNYMKSARATLASMPGMYASVQNPSLAKDLDNHVEASTKVAANLVANRTLAENTVKDLQQQWANEGTLSSIQTWTQQLIPLWSWGNLVNAVPNAKTSTYLHGDNIAQQVQYLYSLPPDQFKDAFTKAIGGISKSSLLDAQVFADAVLSYGGGDRAFDNAMGLLDFQMAFAGGRGIASVGTGFARVTPKFGAIASEHGYELGGKIRSSVSGAPTSIGSMVAQEQRKEAWKRVVSTFQRDAVKASQEKLPEDAHAVMGDVASSAEIKAQKQALDQFRSQDPLDDSKKLFESLPHFVDVTKVGDNAASLSEGQTNQLVREVATMQAQGLKALSNPSKIIRTTPEAMELGFKEAEANLRDRLKSVSDAILDVNFIAPEANRANVGMVEARVGKVYNEAADRITTQAARDAEFEAAAPKVEASDHKDFPPWFSTREEFEASLNNKPDHEIVKDLIKTGGGKPQAERPPIPADTPNPTVWKELAEEPTPGSASGKPMGMDWNPKYLKDKEVHTLLKDLGPSLWTTKGVRREARGSKPLFDQTGFREEFPKQPGPDEPIDRIYDHRLEANRLSSQLTKEQKLQLAGLSPNEQAVKAQSMVASKEPWNSIIRDDKTINGLYNAAKALPPNKRAPLVVSAIRKAYNELPESMQYSVSKNPTWGKFLELEQKFRNRGKTFVTPTSSEPTGITKAAIESTPKFARVTENEVKTILGNMPDLIGRDEATKAVREVLALPEAKRAKALTDYVQQRIQIHTAIAREKNNGVMPEYFRWQSNQGFKKVSSLFHEVQNASGAAAKDLSDVKTPGYTQYTRAKEQQQQQKYHITDPDSGEKLGYIKAEQRGTHVRIDMMRNDSGTAFTPKVIRNVLNQLKEDFPDALTVSGNRISGARGKLPYNQGQASLKLRDRPQEWQRAKEQQQKMTAETKMGDLSAALFDNEDQAKYYAKNVYKLNDEAYNVRQQGSGFYLSISKAVDETSEGFRNLLIQPKSTSKHRFIDNFLGSLVTPDEKLSELATENRKVAVNAQKSIYKALRPIAKDIAKLDRPGLFRRALGLGHDEFGELETVLEKNRDFIDPDTGARGQYYKNVGEFEKAFADTHDKMPTYNQTRAYFAATTLNDIDYIQRNVNFALQAQRAGLEKVNPKIFLNGDDGVKKAVDTQEFLGRVSDKLPWSEGAYTNPEDAGILVVDHDTGTARYYDRNKLAQDTKNEISSKIGKRGYKVIEIAQPMERPLKGIGHDSEIVNFLVARDFDANKPNWLNYPYRPGGHVIYNDPYYVKQPVIRAKDSEKRGSGRYTRQGHYYDGDVSIMNVANESDAKTASKNMDIARQLLKDGKDEELRQHLSKTSPFKLDDFKAMFEERELRDGTKAPPMLSKEHPITWTREGRNVADMDHMKGVLERQYPGFTNSTRSGYNISALLDKKFWGERDMNLPRYERYGTDANPIFRLEEPRLMRPLEAMNTGVANAMRTRFLGDYKVHAVEHFIQEFADVAQPGYTIERMRQNPLYYLHNFPFDTETANTSRLNMARQVRMRTLNFLGTHTQFKQTVDMFQRKLIDGIYGVGGQKGGDWITDHMLPATQDPFTYARSMAFHLNLGLFNPAQIVVQGMAALHAVGIAGPRLGIEGMGKAMLMQLLNHTDNPNIINHFTGIASRLGANPEHFAESFQLLKDTGFDFVGKETAWRNDVQDPKLFDSAFGNFLSWGATFFNTGESFGRLTAWNVAYKEFREANPAKVIGQADRNAILNRADLLSGNMTRASHASYEHGILSIPSQYWAWKMRMMEQLLGTRLTTAEKARTLFTYSVLFGLPVGLNAGIGVYPLYDEAKQAAMRHHINTDETKMHLIMDGVFSTAVREMVGKDYNIPTRYGPDAIPIFRDVLMGDKGVVDLLQGASGSSIGNMFRTAAPFTRYALSMFDPDKKVTAEDFLEASKGFSSANVALRSWYAYNAGRYISRNHNVVTDKLTKTDAGLMLLGGLLPQEVGETGELIKYLKDDKLAKNKIKKEFQLYYRRSLEAGANGDQEWSDLYGKRAKALLESGGFLPHEQAQMIHQVMAEHKTLYDKLQQTRSRRDPAWWVEGSVAKHAQEQADTAEGASGQE